MIQVAEAVAVSVEVYLAAVEPVEGAQMANATAGMVHWVGAAPGILVAGIVLELFAVTCHDSALPEDGRRYMAPRAVWVESMTEHTKLVSDD